MSAESYDSPLVISARPRARAAVVRSDWRRALKHRIWLTDVIVVIAAAFGAQWFRFESLSVEQGVVHRGVELAGLSYTVVSAVLALGWLWALSLAESRSDQVLGQGADEYRKVTMASLAVFGAIAVVAYLLQIEVARGYLLISLPAGLLLLLASRRGWRQWLTRRRLQGEHLTHVLLVGSADTVAQIAHELHRNPAAGYRVVGACLSDNSPHATVPGTDIPVHGNVDDISRALTMTEADTVAISGSSDLPPDKVKRIAWGLEATGHQLVLTPSIVDIAGPRIHTRNVQGLPLIHVEIPELSKGQRFIKRTFDLVASTLGVVMISPLLLALAIIVKATDGGPVLFRQTRVGLDGKSFTMWKFRSMVTNAEALRQTLLTERAADGEGAAGADVGNTVLAKWRHDPRITPAGRWMRRYSLDELPQLFNVITGSMSLVGPRPPLADEVAQYEDHVHRRFLMKPGITGLWQVSGRSTLSWDDSVRLDLSYVENYSLFSDLIILFRTVRAVVRPGETAC